MVKTIIGKGKKGRKGEVVNVDVDPAGKFTAGVVDTGGNLLRFFCHWVPVAIFEAKQRNTFYHCKRKKSLAFASKQFSTSFCFTFFISNQKKLTFSTSKEKKIVNLASHFSFSREVTGSRNL